MRTACIYVLCKVCWAGRVELQIREVSRTWCSRFFFFLFFFWGGEGVEALILRVTYMCVQLLRTWEEWGSLGDEAVKRGRDLLGIRLCLSSKTWMLFSNYGKSGVFGWKKSENLRLWGNEWVFGWFFFFFFFFFLSGMSKKMGVLVRALQK